MDNKKKETPKNYDRWDKTCVKFNDAPQKKVVKKVKRGK